jgi:hypothetical protein
MELAFLWIDASIVFLLWAAFSAACIGRLRRKWVRCVLTVIVFLAPLFPLGVFLATAAFMKFGEKLKPNRFGYALSLLIVYVLGSVMILWQSRQRKHALSPAAANWRPIPLGLSFLALAGLGYLALCNFDQAVRTRCEMLSVQIGQQYWVLAPSITTESQNAANLYEQAFARLKEDTPENINNPPIGDGDNFNPDEPATNAFLARQAGTIALLREAAAMPACRFDADSNAPSTKYTPDFNLPRRAANLVDLDAEEEVARGNIKSAMADVSAAVAMARCITQRPTVVSALVGIGIDDVGISMLERTLPAVKSQEDLAGLHLNESSSLGRAYQQALRGQEQYGLITYGTKPDTTILLPNLSKKGKEGDFVDIDFTPWTSFFLRVYFLDVDNYVSLMEKYRAYVSQPYYQIRNKLTNIERQYHGAMTSFEANLMQGGLAVNSIAVARDACAKIAVAMTRYRLDHGSLPKKLDELVPKYMDAIPIDPFDGRSLRLAIKKDNYIIYSVGPDGVDDGGVNYWGNHGKGDVIFTLKATPFAATTQQ